MSTIASIISWIVFGLIIGALARFLMPGRQNMSLLMTCGLGIVGSFVGGAISQLLFGGGAGWVNPSGWIMSLLGAVLVLWIYTKTATRRGHA